MHMSSSNPRVPYLLELKEAFRIDSVVSVAAKWMPHLTFSHIAKIFVLRW